MGKHKQQRHMPAPSGPATVPSVRPRESAQISWKYLGMGLLVALALGAVWWWGIRPAVLVRQARSLLSSDPREAARLLEEAVVTSPRESPEAEVLWSRALVRAGDWEEAIGCFSQIQAPEQAPGAELLALAEDAIEFQVPLLATMSLEAISASSLQRGPALERLITLKQHRGQDSEIMHLTSEWAELQPDNPSPWLIRAQVDERRLFLSHAATSYREALSRETDVDRRAKTLRSLIQLLIHLGECPEARTRSDELSGLPITVTPVDRLLDAQLRRVDGDVDGAWSLVQGVLDSEPRHAPALELRGTLAMDRQDYPAAIRDLQGLLEQQPWNQRAHYKLSQCFARLGRDADAKTQLLESQRLLALSQRILELQSREKLSSEEVQELVQSLQETGLQHAAERVQRVPSEGSD